MPTTRPLSAKVSAPVASGEETLLAEWTVHLLGAEPGRLRGIVAVTFLAGAVGALSLHHWIGGFLGAGFVLSSVTEYVLPIRYRLTTRGAYCSYGLVRLEIAWHAIRRVIELPDGVRLTPLARPSRLDPFRGVPLRLPSAADPLARDEVIAIISDRTAVEAVQKSDGQPQTVERDEALRPEGEK